MATGSQTLLRSLILFLMPVLSWGFPVQRSVAILSFAFERKGELAQKQSERKENQEGEGHRAVCTVGFRVAVDEEGLRPCPRLHSCHALVCPGAMLRSWRLRPEIAW